MKPRIATEEGSPQVPDSEVEEALHEFECAIDDTDTPYNGSICGQEGEMVITPESVNIILKLLRKAQQPRQEWRTMESAPRDGTEIFVYGGSITNDMNMRTENNCSIRKVKFCPYRKYWDVQDCGYYSSWIKKPTHWQPLPSPPKAEK